MRGRSDRRNSRRRAESPASSAAMSTYASAESATRSPYRSAVSRLADDPAGVAIAAERYHRHSHPQRLAGRGGAIIGKWIQRNIDAVVEGEMRVAFRQLGDEFDPLPPQPRVARGDRDTRPASKHRQTTFPSATDAPAAAGSAISPRYREWPADSFAGLLNDPKVTAPVARQGGGAGIRRGCWGRHNRENTRAGAPGFRSPMRRPLREGRSPHRPGGSQSPPCRWNWDSRAM